MLGNLLSSNPSGWYLTRIIHPNTAEDEVFPFMVMVLPYGSGRPQQDNAPCHTKKTA